MKKFTFIDFFAWAGGFSEWFLQAEHENSGFDFLLANDINENCELTHIARYNKQLGLDMKFIKKDISDPDFLNVLRKNISDREIDVICWWPPCQSFSLAWKRKKYDKKDDLFSSYLKVIKYLKPKYFIMENVKGILTKEWWKIRELILNEIKSIINPDHIKEIIVYLDKLRKNQEYSPFLVDCCKAKLRVELNFEDEEKHELALLKLIDSKFKEITTELIDYKKSKTNKHISTVRHWLKLLSESSKLDKIKKKVIKEKTICDLDNDFFIDDFNAFITSISKGSIVEKIQKSLNQIPEFIEHSEIEDIHCALDMFSVSLNESLDKFKKNLDLKDEKDFSNLIEKSRLYNIKDHILVKASDYWVPQDRERVLFVWSRFDQKEINSIPPTISDKDKVTVYESINDLSFLLNDNESFEYKDDKINQSLSDFQKRNIDGSINTSSKKSYIEWSRAWRLRKEITFKSKPFYIKEISDIEDSSKYNYANLQNHKTSKQNDKVVKRLKTIIDKGSYKKAKDELISLWLNSNKRNYNILKKDGQSPTIMTIPDDYVHYSLPRSLTVREMARLQSFDDSFVFQWKRSTWWNKRKTEVPQYTLVWNAVPPLMARGIAMEILRNIK